MTHAAAPGGVSARCRGGDARCGCGRHRTTRVYESPDAGVRGGRSRWLLPGGLAKRPPESFWESSRVPTNAERGIPAGRPRGGAPCALRLPPPVHRGRRPVCSGPGRCAGRRLSTMPVHDGGLRHPRAFCQGLGHKPQAAGLPHRLLRRHPLAGALAARVATTRPQPPQTMAPPRRR